MVKVFQYDAYSGFGDEAEIFGTPDVFRDSEPMPIRMRRSAYLEPCGFSDFSSGEVEGELSAFFFDTYELPVKLRKNAKWFPYGITDFDSGSFAEPDGQSFFDCGRMPILRSRDWIRDEHGLHSGHTLWVSIGARYGEMRTIMSRLGNLETRPARHGSVRVAPVQ